MATGQCYFRLRPTVTFPDTGYHRPSTGIKSYCLVTEPHVCEQLAHGLCALKKTLNGNDQGGHNVLEEPCPQWKENVVGVL